MQRLCWPRTAFNRVVGHDSCPQRDQIQLFNRLLGEATDPVCGMKVKKKKAAATAEHDGETYYFCAPGCKKKFEENPEQYLEGEEGE